MSLQQVCMISSPLLLLLQLFLEKFVATSPKRSKKFLTGINDIVSSVFEFCFTINGFRIILVLANSTTFNYMIQLKTNQLGTQYFTLYNVNALALKGLVSRPSM